MATFNVTGFDELEKMILRQSEEVERIAPDMLRAGAKVLAAAQRAELRRHVKGRRSIGTLAGSVGFGKVKGSATSSYIDVYPLGDQPHGFPRVGQRGKVTNAQVGFMLNYGYTARDKNGRGVSRVVGTRWMESANNSSSSAVHDAMRRVWEDKQRE